jgi:hypothetical protein
MLLGPTMAVQICVIDKPIVRFETHFGFLGVTATIKITAV